MPDRLYVVPLWRAIGVALLMMAIAAAAGGCATLDLRDGIDDARLARQAVVAGLPGVRFWGDEVPADIGAEVKRRLPNMPGFSLASAKLKERPVVDILALSGGGGDGAFGAGLLAGWTARGDRPEFEVVTGISAGAIIAPFAFLGPQYDKDLEEIWTGYKTSQIATAQILPGLLGGPALADTAPLKALIARYVDHRMMREIAHEYQRRGRILLVGTTNLDAQRPVVWNMGEIAASKHPNALHLFRDVILASAAIPGAFPPVDIKVQVDGKIYSEMHVDGGTTQEIFVSPVKVPFRAFDRLYKKPPVRRIYIVNNAKIDPEQKVIRSQTIPIASRAISTLIKSQSQGEIYRIYRMAKDAGADFNFIAVPREFEVQSEQFFDPVYQRALFDEGYKVGKAGNRWLKQPPDTIAQN
ncbi:patatin-like phospholipase family protein [Filomicrobium insigne]|uniref:patatin-like phospholipase family protein n=1 Tax=Filomicrobium insigne TaxID=418854 RepID=UPI001FCD29EA|nr:patatin-like phospholipase family protein [Filomicrobium insigne]